MMPTPGEGESKQDFISRCISYVENEDNDMTHEQIQAYCYDIWEKDKEGLNLMHTTRRVNLEPIRSFQDEEGKTKYRAMAIRFGSPEETDWYGTYFDKDTEYHLDWFRARPWIYDHGYNPMMKSMRVGEWTDVEWSDEGIFFVGELLEHFKYQEAVQELINRGVLYPSTGTLSYLMDWDWDTGHMKSWPIVELSSTTSPAEYRMEPMTPEVAKAVRALEGGLREMGDKESLLSRLKSKIAARGEPEPGDEEPLPETEEAGTEVDGDDEEEPTMSVGELYEQLGLDQHRQAIEQLDAALRDLQIRQDSLEAAHNELASSRAQAIKEAITGGQNWVDSLFVASRDAETGAADEETLIQGTSSLQGGPAAIIQQQQNPGT